jgi:uncharacterized protein (UPF0332 family)
MSINHHQFLGVAVLLCGNDETHNRTAISRAYYCAYHACANRYKPTSAGGMHAAMIETLTKSPSAQERKAGYILKELRDLRVIADYKLSSSITPQDTEHSIRQTEKLINTLNPPLTS